VTLETEVTKVVLIKASFDDVQRCNLFADKEHPLTKRQEFRNYVGDRLALARSRWPVQHQILSALYRQNCLELTAVAVEDCVKASRMYRIIKFLRGGDTRPRRKCCIFVAGNGTADRVSCDRISIFLQIIPHRQFLETERAERSPINNFPPWIGLDAFADAVQPSQPLGARLKALVRYTRQLDTEVAAQQLRERMVGDLIVVSDSEHPLSTARSTAKLNGHKQEWGLKSNFAVDRLVPIQETKRHEQYVHPLL